MRLVLLGYKGVPCTRYLFVAELFHVFQWLALSLFQSNKQRGVGSKYIFVVVDGPVVSVLAIGKKVRVFKTGRGRGNLRPRLPSEGK
jgi:hypothetical protein